MEKLIKIVNEQPCKKIVFTDFQGLSLNFYKNSEQRKPESFRETNMVILKVNDRIIGKIEEYFVEPRNDDVQRKDSNIEYCSKTINEEYLKKDESTSNVLYLSILISDEADRSKGFMTQAMRIYSRVLFSECGEKILIRDEIEERNQRSRAFHERFGFLQSGSLLGFDIFELTKSNFEKAENGLKEKKGAINFTIKDCSDIKEIMI